MRVVFVHGACVRDGTWWWHRAADLLSRHGVNSIVPPLPSCGETGRTPDAAGPSLSDDVASVRQALRADYEPTVVVAHSYGGMVVSGAATDLPHVQHLLLIDSFLPEVGESLASFSDGSPAPYIDLAADGTFGVRSKLATQTFLQDCDQDVVEPAHARLVRQCAAVTSQPVTAAAWHDIRPQSAPRTTAPHRLQRDQSTRAGRAAAQLLTRGQQRPQPR